MTTLGTLKSQHALAVRHHGADSPQARETGGKLAAQKAAVHIQRLLAAAPPLTNEQRAQLAELLKPAREHIKTQRLAELDTSDGTT